MYSYSKVHTAVKKIVSKPQEIRSIVLNTMDEIARIVGSSLGPGGRVSLLERNEAGFPPIVTKDGVTIFKSLGFTDANAHMVMEVARDAAMRTAEGAGDGTTGSTILANSILQGIDRHCRDNPKDSPQKVIRDLKKVLTDFVVPEIKKHVVPCSLLSDRGLLKTIATVSANGDLELAEAVLNCFEATGDAGNVTLLEEMSPTSQYVVEKIEGYPVADSGWHHSCEPYSPKYINDTANQQVILDKPYFIVVYGPVNDLGPLLPLLDCIGQKFFANPKERNSVVIVATNFSENVKASLGASFATAQSYPKVYPMLAPPSPLPNGVLGFMQDLCVVTGQKELFDPINKPLNSIWIDDLGSLAKRVEVSRFRTNIFSDNSSNELDVIAHVETLEKQVPVASKLEKIYLQERIGKMTGGIAKLRILGPSSGELRERRDRAEDAVCAVRGAIKHGALPGGASVLTYISGKLSVEPNLPLCSQILTESLLAPIVKLLDNSAFNKEDASDVILSYVNWGKTQQAIKAVFDIVQLDWINPVNGLLDSAPAVLEALNNAFSIASSLGIVGGLVSFPRDNELDRAESKANYDFGRKGNVDV